MRPAGTTAPRARDGRAGPVTFAEPDEAPVRSRRSTLAQLAVTAVLVGLAAVMDVLVSWHVPAGIDSCADGAILDCPEAMTVTIVPGLAAMAGLLVWLVGSMARERRGGLAWCWVAVVVAALPAVFLVPGLAF